MRKAGVTDYPGFAREVLRHITDRPISFEVFADDLPGMRAQALEIASWGPNVYVKIPITNTAGVSTAEVTRELSAEGVQVNVTALMTLAQVEETVAAVADGRPVVHLALRRAHRRHRRRPRADGAGRRRGPRGGAARRADLGEPARGAEHRPGRRGRAATSSPSRTTCSPSSGGLGKDLDRFSLETVQMFHDDAAASGFALEPASSRA